MSWLGLVLTVGVLVASIPACRDQYRCDRAGFFKTLRVAGLYLLYVFAGIGLVLALLSGQPSAMTAVAATVFVVAFILYGGLWLARVVPRYRELPAFVDKFPGVLDYGFWAVMAAGIAFALLA
jgi:hypothetical protein